MYACKYFVHVNKSLKKTHISGDEGRLGSVHMYGLVIKEEFSGIFENSSGH